MKFALRILSQKVRPYIRRSDFKEENEGVAYLIVVLQIFKEDPC